MTDEKRDELAVLSMLVLVNLVLAWLFLRGELVELLQVLLP